MTKITYIPPEGDAAEAQWGRYLFNANVPLEVSDRHILAKAATNPHFRVESESEAGAVRAEPAKPEPPKPAKPKPGKKARA